MSLLEINNLSHQYGPDERVFDVFDLAVAGGQSVLLIGDNGSGKSTLGRIVCGLLAPSSGRVRVRGEDVLQMRAARRVRHAYYVSQVNQLQFIKSTLAEEVRHAERVSGSRMDEEAYAHFGLPDDRDTNPFELTVHEAWRFALLLATVVDPAVLFIDEIPSAANASNLGCLRYLVGRREARDQITILCYQRPVELGQAVVLEIGSGTLRRVGDRGAPHGSE
jgi:ABC-type multidrug transport system ATPase subunit